MAKLRVYELARELGLESKEVLARAQELDIAVNVDILSGASRTLALDEDPVDLTP